MRTGAAGELIPTSGFSRWRAQAPAPGVASFWRSHDGLLVSSSCERAQYPGAAAGDAGPTWVLAVSCRGGRADDQAMRRVAVGFNAPEWEEDNHFPGITRTLFIPIDETRRGVCDCKLSETTIVDADGYTWTNPVDGPCRGCELERLSAAVLGEPKPCPVHAAGSSC